MTLAFYTLYRDDILAVRAPALTFYVLRASDGLYLIDCGFIGGRYLLRRALKARGWHNEPIRGILVTHGHLDHILNVSAIADESGAWVAAPILDADHYSGRYSYSNASHVCGILESVGRPLLGYKEFHIDRPLDDLSEIPVWKGLVAIHLPGHTEGHVGFYSPDLRLLFSADLFASYGTIAHLPPNIFNDKPDLIPGSVEKALSLDIDGIIPNHCDTSSPEEHLSRLRALSGINAS